MHRLFSAVFGGLAAVVVTTPAAVDARVQQSAGLAVKKSIEADTEGGGPPLLATLVQTHTDERVLLDDETSLERFSALLSDRATGEKADLDPRLLDLLRSLAKNHPGSRIELVSGYRSPKLNEMLRKKGHNVASHSQHSLGHACDFRIVPPGASKAIAPADMEREIRGLGWDGGVGTYPLASDWFVHADVGRNRRW